MRATFYKPADWLAHTLTARTRRALNFWMLALWIIPGLPIWLLLRHSLWFVGLMSLVALWWTGWTGVGTETPVEHETHDA